MVDTTSLAILLAPLPPPRLASLQEEWQIPKESLGKVGGERLAQQHALARRMLHVWPIFTLLSRLPTASANLLITVNESRARYNIASLVSCLPEGVAPADALAPLLHAGLLVVGQNSRLYGSFSIWSPGEELRDSTVLLCPPFFHALLGEAIRFMRLTPAAVDAMPLATLVKYYDLDAALSRLKYGSTLQWRYGSHVPQIVSGILSDPGAIQRQVRGLESGARRIYQELAQSAQPVPASSLRKGGEADPAIEPILDDCLAVPLLVGREPALYVHPDVRRAFAGMTPFDTLPTTMDPLPAPPHRLDVGPGLFWNLMVLFDWVAGGEARLTQSRDVPKRIRDRIEKASVDLHAGRFLGLTGVDLDLFYLRILDVAKCDDRQYTPGEQADSWKQLSLAGQELLLLKTWLELGADPGIPKSLPGYQGRGTVLSDFRIQLLRALLELPPDQWYSLRQFSLYLMGRNRYLLRTEAILKDMFGPAYLSVQRATWFVDEGLVIRETLLGLLLQMGVLNVGELHLQAADPDDDVTNTDYPDLSFCVTEHGRETLHRLLTATHAETGSRRRFTRSTSITAQPGGAAADSSAAAADRVLVVQPNLEVLMMEMAPQVAYALREFATPVSFDRIGRFTLSAESVRLAASRGLTYQAIEAVLSRYCAQPVPQNVAYQLRDWAGTVQRISFERGIVVEVDSPESMSRLLAAKGFRPRVIRTLGPTMVLIRAQEDISALARSLAAAGFSWSPPDGWDKEEVETLVGMFKLARKRGVGP